MNLEDILAKDESPKLDFKEIWEPEKIAGEYIKDIISLSNGSPDCVGQKGFLVFGISDNKNRFITITDEELFKKNTPNLATLTKQLLDKWNSFVHPSILGLKLSFVPNSSKGRLLVIEIPNHPYLLSLSKELEFKKVISKQGKSEIKQITYRKGTVFYRIEEGINVASPEVIRAFDIKLNSTPTSNDVVINNSDNTKIAVQNSVNHGTQTFNF